MFLLNKDFKLIVLEVLRCSLGLYILYWILLIKKFCIIVFRNIVNKMIKSNKDIIFYLFERRSYIIERDGIC